MRFYVAAGKICVIALTALKVGPCRQPDTGSDDLFSDEDDYPVSPR